MKISWGNKILIALILFVVLMGTLVYKSIHTQYDLVSDTYYKEELDYQKIIDGSKHVSALQDTLLIVKDEKSVHIKFPDDLKKDLLEGSITFYSPSSVGSDRFYTIQKDSMGMQSFTLKDLPKGNYVLKIDAIQGSINYYWEQNFNHLP